MKSKISIHDFEFRFAGYGHYNVIYKSPVTGKTWSTTISDMTIIDATRNAEEPKVKDLNRLKKICKDANKEWYGYGA